MKRPVNLLLIVSMVLAAPALYAQAPNPDAKLPLYKRVDAAIKKGSEKLLSMQQADGSWPEFKAPPHVFPGGPTAIAVYALLESGVEAQDPRIVKALDWLTAQQAKEVRYDPSNPNKQPPQVVWPSTYETALRLNCWSLADKQTQGKYVKQLKHDAKLLEDSTISQGLWIGTLSYHANGNPVVIDDTDNSNTQFGLLGMWMASRDVYEVDDAYWQKCRKHWIESQRPDGGWGYSRGEPDSRATMTAAGLASMFILYDKLTNREFRDCRGQSLPVPIERGMRWLNERFEAVLNGTQGVNTGPDRDFYFLYGVERVGLASGYKYFGTVDWFKLGAERLLSLQLEDGSWKSLWQPTPTTSFALLFLARGRNAVVFNKLQFESDGGGGKVDNADWNCRPRDLAFLTGWINNTIVEKPINWQIVNTSTPVEDWHDANILYVSGSKPPKFTQADIKKLRQFVEQGGMIFSVSECDGKKAFGESMKKVYAQMFPEYPMTKMDTKNPIYTLGGATQLKGEPALEWITNGIRPLVIHCDTDLAKSWQMNTTGTDKKLFQLGANLFFYATDKQPKQRGSFIWPEEAKATDNVAISVGRVKWGDKGANWNPEPLALTRLVRMMTAQTGHDVKALADGVEAAKAGDSKATVLVLTGVGALKLTSEEETGLKKYVENGGTLLVDAAGGKEDFGRSSLSAIEGVFGASKVSMLSTSHKVFNLAEPADGVITKLQVRPATRDRLGLATSQIEPKLRCVSVSDNGTERVGVFYSREDISSAGLVGYDSLGVDGYGPSGNLDAPAYRLMRNIVLYAAKQTGSTPASQPAAAATQDTK